MNGNRVVSLEELCRMEWFSRRTLPKAGDAFLVREAIPVKATGVQFPFQGRNRGVIIHTSRGSQPYAGKDHTKNPRSPLQLPRDYYTNHA